MTSIGGSSPDLFSHRVRFSGRGVPWFDPPAEDVASCFHFSMFSVLALFVVAALVMPVVESGDAEALMALKAIGDPLHVLPWPEGGDVCRWRGVSDCLGGRVTKLVLEYLNLTGRLDSAILSRLDQLRVLSFKGNSMSGDVPDLSPLVNLKSLYLSDNNFSGVIPPSLGRLHRLKVIVLAGNRISGEIPESLMRLPRLYVLYLQDNELTGRIPALNQTSLRAFNVSNNQLSGEIPVTPAMLRFDSLSFTGNLQLCGEQVGKPCTGTGVEAPKISSSGTSVSTESLKAPNHKKRRIIAIIAGTVGGFLLIVCCVVICGVIVSALGQRHVQDTVADGRAKPVEASGGDYREKQEEFSWEGESLGSLVFLGNGDQQMSYSLEDLLKASAESLGRGRLGSTYKAVMESGFTVTVKRLKDARYPHNDEFQQHMDLLGSLRHPNVVPLRAYFQAKEERLLVYDHFPNGSLFTLVHGSRTSGDGKPLHWTSCLKIAEDLAAGLLYIHQSHGLAHGNLKSSNVLLGPDFESCLTDYGLYCFQDPDSTGEPSSAPHFYVAPECRDPVRPPTLPSDIYSFGVLLLELLTGKSLFQDLTVEEIPGWVKSAREEQTESGEDPETASSNDTSEEKIRALMDIAIDCLCNVADNRPTAREVMKMIRDARLASNASSNGSDQSPGRRLDTVHGLPK